MENKMKIGQKLILGFVGIALLVGVVGYVGFNSNKRIDENAHIVDLAHSAYEEIAKLEAIVLDQVHEGMHLLSFEEEECIEKFKELGKKYEQAFAAAAAAAAAAQPEVKAKFKAIATAHEKFERLFDEVVKAHYSGQLATREQRRSIHGIWCPVSDEVIELTRGLQPLYTEMAEKEHKKAHQLMIRTTRNIILISIIGVLLALGFGLLIARGITRPITKLKDAATEIGKGKLDTRVVIKSKDEIGFLAASFNKMAEDLNVSIQKEKELAAAAAAAETDRKRTVELEKAYSELREKSERLERFHSVAVDQELEMVRLEEEVNTLLEKLGQPKKYETPEKIQKRKEVI